MNIDKSVTYKNKILYINIIKFKILEILIN